MHKILSNNKVISTTFKGPFILMRNAIIIPNRLLCMVWLSAIILYSIAFRSVPSSVVVSWVAVLILAFSVGGMIKVPMNISSIGSMNNTSVLRIMVFIMMPFELMYILKVFYLAAEYGGIKSYLSVARQASNSGDPLISGSNFYLQINLILLMLCLYGISLSLFSPNSQKTGAHKKHFYIIFIITLFSSLLDGSRNIVISGILYLLALNLAYGRLRVQLLILYLIVMLSLFTISFFVFRADAVANNFLVAVKYMFVYASGSVGSMHVALQNNVEVYWRDLESLLNKLFFLGLPVHYYDMTDLKMDNIDLPGGEYNTNVFSAFAIYYQYFGYIGGVCFSLFIGVFSGNIYRRRLKSPFLTTVYAFIWAAIVLSPFHDYFLVTFYMTVKLLILIIIATAFSVMKRFLLFVTANSI